MLKRLFRDPATEVTVGLAALTLAVLTVGVGLSRINGDLRFLGLIGVAVGIGLFALTTLAVIQLVMEHRPRSYRVRRWRLRSPLALIYEEDNEELPASKTEVDATQLERWRRLEVEDRARLSHARWQETIWQWRDPIPYLTGVDSRIEPGMTFRFSFRYANVIPLVIDRIEGHVKFLNAAVGDSVRLVEPGPHEREAGVEHSALFSVVVAVTLQSAETGRTIREEIEQKGSTIFRFDDVRLWIRAKSDADVKPFVLRLEDVRATKESYGG